MQGKGKGDSVNTLDESILTAVPKSQAVPKNLVDGLPFDHSGCKGCPRFGVCENAAAHLPFIVRSLHRPGSEFACRRGEPVVMCMVVPKRSASLEGADAEDEGKNHARPRPLYVLDANIFLNAYNRHPDMGDVCSWVLTTSRIRICTTRQVLAEAYDRKGNALPPHLEMVEVGKIDERIMNLRPAEFTKEPSDADRSLMQAVLNNPEIRGIVTFDPDFVHVAASGLLSQWTGRKVDILKAFDLRAKYR